VNRMTYKQSNSIKESSANKALRKRQMEFEAEAFPHKDILYNFSLRTTGNADDAKDLLQETFMKAFRFWDKYEKGTNIRAWLFRIMKNSYINRYRKETREPGMVDYDDVENFYDSIRDDSTDSNDLQKQMYSNMLSDEVTGALQSLPEDFRTVVILCDIEQLTYEEISDFLNCPIGTVRSRLHRGRKMLEEKLHDYAKQRGILMDDSHD
jgi:RNA polymerase sigma-70 factor, ECF subfamily